METNDLYTKLKQKHESSQEAYKQGLLAEISFDIERFGKAQIDLRTGNSRIKAEVVGLFEEAGFKVHINKTWLEHSAEITFNE